jgi:threonine dehydrogenase-like Zn-dependent dehydrogenase
MSAGADNYGGRTMHTFDIYLELIRDGIIDVKPLVTHKFRLEQYQQAFKTCANKRLTKSIKVLFDFS